ncbi:MAG: glycosyltransferase family 4 protein [Candidatus Chisholmbacteria bacterium]|nr:glycosyltransferase family 4 protein [Candidatus Chisholmbacteria bacterium]
MKLCFITEFFPENESHTFSGGVEAHTFYLVEELKRQRQKVQVICRTPTNIAASYSSLPSRIGFIVTAFIKALSADTDVIVGTNFVTYLPAFLAASLAKKPSVAWYPDVLIGHWRAMFGSLGFLGEIAEKIVVRLPWSKIIALSHQTKRRLVKLGVNPAKITVVYPGVETREIKSVRVPKSKFPTISFIGRFVSYKRTTDLVVAFVTVLKKFPEAKLHLIGWGPQEKQLRSQVKTLGVDRAVRFHSHVPRPKLIALLKASHILCSPSIIEGFGLVTIEATASGVPFVNAATPINREVTAGGLGGLLFEPKNPKDLAQKIITLLSDKNLYLLKQREGKTLVKKYSWQKTAAKTLKALHSVVG